MNQVKLDVKEYAKLIGLVEDYKRNIKLLHLCVESMSDYESSVVDYHKGFLAGFQKALKIIEEGVK